MVFDEADMEVTDDMQKFLVLVEYLQTERETLQAQVDELLVQKNQAENKLLTSEARRELMEEQVRRFEATLEHQMNEKTNLNLKLQGESDRCELLEIEIKYLKSKAENLTGAEVDDSYEMVKDRIWKLEQELSRKEEDHARTQEELNKLAANMNETEIHRNKIRQMHSSLVKAEKKLENVEWERKREEGERLLLQERERLLERRNQELESKLEETLLILQERQDEMKSKTMNEKREEVPSLGESLSQITHLSDEELVCPSAKTVLSDEEEETDEQLIGKIRVGSFWECEICNQFLVRFSQRCVFTTEKIFRQHEKSIHHQENVRRMGIGLKGSLHQWFDKRMKMANRDYQHRRPVRNKQLPGETPSNQSTKRVTITPEHSKKDTHAVEKKKSKAKKRSKKETKLSMKPSERRKARALEKQRKSKKKEDPQSHPKSFVSGKGKKTYNRRKQNVSNQKRSKSQNAASVKKKRTASFARPKNSAKEIIGKHIAERKMSAPGLKRARKVPRSNSVLLKKHERRSTRKQSKPVKPPMVRHNVAVQKFQDDATFVDSLSLQQIYEFQQTLNAL